MLAYLPQSTLQIAGSFDFALQLRAMRLDEPLDTCTLREKKSGHAWMRLA